MLPVEAGSFLIFHELADAEVGDGGDLPTDYALKRLHAEQAAATRATSNVARDVHERLAERYAEIVRQQAPSVSR